MTFYIVSSGVGTGYIEISVRFAMEIIKVQLMLQG